MTPYSILEKEKYEDNNPNLQSWWWYRFSDRKATLFTYTGDVLAFSPSPPAIYGMVNFDGGGRWMFDITDTDLDSVKVGMPVEMSYRRKYHDVKRGIHAYYWKATPIRV